LDFHLTFAFDGEVSVSVKLNVPCGYERISSC